MLLSCTSFAMGAKTTRMATTYGDENSDEQHGTAAAHAMRCQRTLTLAARVLHNADAHIRDRLHHASCLRDRCHR